MAFRRVCRRLAAHRISAWSIIRLLAKPWLRAAQWTLDGKQDQMRRESATHPAVLLMGCVHAKSHLPKGTIQPKSNHRRMVRDSYRHAVFRGVNGLTTDIGKCRRTERRVAVYAGNNTVVVSAIKPYIAGNQDIALLLALFRNHRVLKAC